MAQSYSSTAGHEDMSRQELSEPETDAPEQTTALVDAEIASTILLIQPGGTSPVAQEVWGQTNLEGQQFGLTQVHGNELCCLHSLYDSDLNTVEEF